jgi:hypothetical protein
MSCFVSGYFRLYASCFRVISTGGTEWLKVSLLVERMVEGITTGGTEWLKVSLLVEQNG